MNNLVFMRPPTEYQECVVFWKWVKLNNSIRDLTFHIPNEAKRSIGAACALKNTGLVPGVPDYFIALPRGLFGGLFIEMKRNSKKLSKISTDQKLWIEKLLKNGYQACVCYGAMEAIKCVQNYLQSRNIVV